MAKRKASIRRSSSSKKTPPAKSPKSNLTVSLPQFIHHGSDVDFRKFVADLFAAVAGMHSLRRALAAAVGLNAAEYSILLAVSQLQKKGTVGISAIAKNLHVAAANITADVGLLTRKGLLRKRPNPRDTRAVLVELTASGQDILTQLTPLLRRINDRLFSGNKPSDIQILSRFVQHLADESSHSIRMARTFASETAARSRK
jgi:DNA-binding MarR family transcriptional regulator